jgi:hypothetical protein
MRLDAVNLPSRFLATGAALRRPAKPDHRLPCSAVGRKETTDASALVSLFVYMTGGSNRAAGPTCRFKEVAVLGVYPGTPSNFNRVWVISFLNFRIWEIF